MRMRVFYGYAKLTPTIKKRELRVIFENAYTSRNDEAINRYMHVVYWRYQTPGEQSDAQFSNRCFTRYSTFIDSKPFFGDIDKVLDNNYEADSNNISEAERMKIKDALRKEYFIFYGISEVLKFQKKHLQLTLNL